MYVAISLLLFVLAILILSVKVARRTSERDDERSARHSAEKRASALSDMLEIAELDLAIAADRIQATDENWSNQVSELNEENDDLRNRVLELEQELGIREEHGTDGPIDDVGEVSDYAGLGFEDWELESDKQLSRFSS